MDKVSRNGARHTVYFPNGGHYRGEWLNDQRHGSGCMIYRNGDKYFGGWVADRREDIGAFYHCEKGEQRLIYTGEWKQDQPSGHGIFYDVNDCRYEGQWENGYCLRGKRHGCGKILRGSVTLPIYEGEWIEDHREGRGTERYLNGDCFVGHFSQDVKHGEGTYYFLKRQTRLDGIWQHGSCIGGSYRSMRSDEASELPVLELSHPEAVLRELQQSKN